MDDRTFMTLMRLMPKSALSSLVGHATRLNAPRPLHHAAMRAFAKAYKVPLEEAEHPLEGYATFADFFARALKPGLRPIAEGEKVVVSPVDGAISQVGYLAQGQAVQAKGISFPVAKLLGDEESARPFEDGGAFATIYLAPRDYHRIHAPVRGEIEGYRYLPGEFWPVNRISVREKDALFCLNERLITFLATPVGKCAVVKVGATCVARIRASYDQVLTHQAEKRREHWYEPTRPVAKGGELGRFEMGSTVILLFEPGRVRWDERLAPEAVLRMGERMGEGT
jgi:phosphatidylserine decarboxylase